MDTHYVSEMYILRGDKKWKWFWLEKKLDQIQKLGQVSFSLFPRGSKTNDCGSFLPLICHFSTFRNNSPFHKIFQYFQKNIKKWKLIFIKDSCTKNYWNNFVNKKLLLLTSITQQLHWNDSIFSWKLAEAGSFSNTVHLSKRHFTVPVCVWLM